MSGLVGAMSYFSLIWDMVVKDLSQSLATRLALCLAFGLNLASVVLGHGSTGDEVIGSVYTLLALVVLGITTRQIYKSEGDSANRLQRVKRSFTRLDKSCMAISLAGTLLVLATGQSVTGISFAIAADIAAYGPTIGLCWTQPEGQPLTTYPIGAVAAMLTLLTDYSGGGLHFSALFAVYLIILDSALPVLILVRREYRRRKDLTVIAVQAE
jgi:hypothetical protein